VDVPPFNDVRVRQAVKLVVRSAAMMKQVSAVTASWQRLFSPFDFDYNNTLPQRTQDLEKARSLLKKRP